MTRNINRSVFLYILNQIKRRKLEIKHQERKAVSEGKKPYYLKRKDLKKIEHEERVKEITKQGHYSKYIKRKAEKEGKKNKLM